MTMTVHNTPVIKTLIRMLSLLFFKVTGWKAEGHRPDISKYVIIAAPHTSNWDFVYTLCLASIFRINPLIMMKDVWFRWPLGTFFRWLGALPINRSKSSNVVAQSIQAFHEKTHLVMVVPPSGTRKKVMFWKTGFYHIAKGASVPIALGYLDYRRKVGGIGPIMNTTGDLASDMEIIQNFYSDISGKYPERRIQPLALSLPS